jgi:hypothetical protein
VEECPYETNSLFEPTALAECEKSVDVYRSTVINADYRKTQKKHKKNTIITKKL